MIYSGDGELRAQINHSLLVRGPAGREESVGGVCVRNVSLAIRGGSLRFSAVTPLFLFRSFLSILIMCRLVVGDAGNAFWFIC